MSRLFNFEVDAGDLLGMAGRLEAVDGRRLGLAAVEVVNAVVTRFDVAQQAGQIRDIALTPAYVKSKTDLTLASDPANPQATIVTRGDLTVMDRYPLQVLQDPNRLDRAGHRLGKRQAGVRVGIKPSAPVAEPQWFTMRLRAGTASGSRVGVFVRTSDGRKKHLYGPSPYSLFRFQVGQLGADLQQDLETSGVAALSDVIDEALNP